MPIDNPSNELDSTKTVGIPVGGIIPWFGEVMGDTIDDIPTNYTLLDGKTVNEPRSAYHGVTLPDSNKVSLAGTEDPNELGSVWFNMNAIQFKRDSFPRKYHQFKPTTTTTVSDNIITSTNDVVFGNDDRYTQSTPYSSSGGYVLAAKNPYNNYGGGQYSGDSDVKPYVSGTSNGPYWTTTEHVHKLDVRHVHKITDNRSIGDSYHYYNPNITTVGAESAYTIINQDEIPSIKCRYLIRLY